MLLKLLQMIREGRQNQHKSLGQQNRPIQARFLQESLYLMKTKKNLEKAKLLQQTNRLRWRS